MRTKVKEKTCVLLRVAWDNITMRMSQPTIEPKSRRFCGLAHVKTLAVLIAMVEILFLICQGLVATAYLAAPASSHVLAATLQVLAVGCACVAVTLLLLGIFFSIPALVIPHMLMQVMFVLTLLGMASLALYTLLVGTSVNLHMVLLESSSEASIRLLTDVPSFQFISTSRLLIGIIVLIIVGYMTAALINVWCFHVVVDCYRNIHFVNATKISEVSQQNDSSHEKHMKTIPVVHATDF